LDREEAINLYKEIIAQCRINIASVSLVPPRRDDIFSNGYQLQIKSILNSCDIELIHKIVDNHQLACEILDDNIVIYKPQIREAI
jgi:hypothetical protein